MVNHTEEYKHLLQQGAGVYGRLIQLYTPDRRAENDWADISLAETRSYRNGLLERLADPREVTAEDTSTFIVSTGHYLDSHWADYQKNPVANSGKRTQIEQLHAELESVVSGIGQIYNAVRTP